MRAAAIESFGGPEALRVADVRAPTPGPEEIVVRVVAAGLNPVDARVRSGALVGRREHRFPLVLGRDAAGVVEEVGPGVSRLRPGDRVWTYHRPAIEHRGTYAECVVVGERDAARVPTGLLYEEAAAVPCSGLTAWQAVHQLGRVASGATVAILGAAGGVGHLAVQLAVEAGATVVALARSSDHPFLTALGAHDVLDPARDDPARAIRRRGAAGVDLVIDTTGDRRFAHAIEWLAPGGRWVGPAGGMPASVPEGGRSVASVSPRADTAHLDALADRFERRRIRVHVERMWPLADAARAHRALESGAHRGKLVLTL